MATKKGDNITNLLAAIQRQVPAAAPVSEEKTLKEAPIAAPTRGVKASAKSKPAYKLQFYLHDEDRRTIRELAAWLAGQGIRASDSLIIRSALRLTETGGDLLSTYQQLAEMDGRRKRTY